VHADTGGEWNADEHYRNYYSASNVGFDQLTAVRYQLILAECERLHRRGRLLDVGCGAGHLLVVADASGWSAVGQEISSSGLEWLRQLKTAAGRPFDLVSQDLLSADLPPATFSAITIIEVIEHLVDPASTLKRCHELLEPGGVLYLTTPNFDSLSRLMLGGAWRGLTPDHLCLFNVTSMRHALEAAGLRPSRVVTRNIDVPEILLKMRAGRRSAAQAEEPGRPVQTWSATSGLRHRIERNHGLRAAKAAVNTALRAGRCGDTIEAFAVKPARTS
jgi:SAM-dependent methyltransferase